MFSLADVNPDSSDTAGSRIDDIVNYGRLTERYGLDVFGVGEHHTAMYAVSSPAVVLVAIAQATSRIRLTTTATVLSVLDPVRVYQDFATLDLISHGRAELTAGRSAFAEPFALFGEDASRIDQLFADKLEMLLRIRADEPVNWSFGPSLRSDSRCRRGESPARDACPAPQRLDAAPPCGRRTRTPVHRTGPGPRAERGRRRAIRLIVPRGRSSLTPSGGRPGQFRERSA